MKFSQNSFHKIFKKNFLNTIQKFNILIEYQNIIFNEATPLHLAVEKGNIEIIKILLGQKDIDTNIKDEIQFSYFE